MSIEEAMEIDAKRGDTLWFDALQKEMQNVFFAFAFQEEGKNHHQDISAFHSI